MSTNKKSESLDGGPGVNKEVKSGGPCKASAVAVPKRVSLSWREIRLVLLAGIVFACVQGGLAWVLEPPETQKAVTVAILGSLFGAIVGSVIFVIPQIPLGVIERTYLATLTRMMLGLGLAFALLRQIDAPYYQLRIAIYILSAYGANLLVDTIVIARSISSGNSKNGFTPSGE